MKNRGGIASVDSFSSPYSVSGRFLLSSNVYSNSKILLRTDGSSYTAAEMPGVAVQFQNREDAADQNQLSIFTINAPAGHYASVSLNTLLALDTWYDFTIFDDGNIVDILFNGAQAPTLSLLTTWSAGGKIGYYNREGAAAGSYISSGGVGRLDYITVASAVPEPSTSGIAAGTIALIAAFLKRRKGTALF